MYFLNGDRIYIKPEKACGDLDAQLDNCLRQLQKINSGKRIFKLNFFVDTATEEAYVQLQQKVEGQVKSRFSEEIILCLIAQPPLTCKIIVEAFYYDYTLWNSRVILSGNGAAVLFSRENSEILIGNVQSGFDPSCKVNSENAFEQLNEILDEASFPINSIIRQWNYIEDILGFDGANQRYQEFNNARSVVYGDAFKTTGYPAATGIGMNKGGVILEFVAVKSDKAITKPVNNPRQIAAHCYSKNVLIGEQEKPKTTPKFERARYFDLFDKRLIFISGTASITGEKTVGVGDPMEQTRVTIQNIEQLYSPEILEQLADKTIEPKYGHARIYVKRRKDFPLIRRTFKTYFGNLPVVYIIADICRDDLLVEIEGKVILE